MILPPWLLCDCGSSTGSLFHHFSEKKKKKVSPRGISEYAGPGSIHLVQLSNSDNRGCICYIWSILSRLVGIVSMVKEVYLLQHIIGTEQISRRKGKKIPPKKSLFLTFPSQGSDLTRKSLPEWKTHPPNENVKGLPDSPLVVSPVTLQQLLRVTLFEWQMLSVVISAPSRIGHEPELSMHFRIHAMCECLWQLKGKMQWNETVGEGGKRRHHGWCFRVLPWLDWQNVWDMMENWYHRIPRENMLCLLSRSNVWVNIDGGRRDSGPKP